MLAQDILLTLYIIFVKISAEFQRLVAIPLEQKFLAQLNKYSDQLIHIIRAKGGATCEKNSKHHADFRPGIYCMYFTNVHPY